MPDDFARNDEIGASPLPLLCDDHAPVIELARHLQHVGDRDVVEAAESKATSCPTCYRLNGRSLT